jgi:hypothetical protein
MEGGGKWGKPDRVHGIEIRWGILTAPPVNAGDLPNSSFDTRSPFVLTLPGEERGKQVYFADRREINRKGDWGETVSEFIP